ncbi:MAG: hypothetical protein QG621_91 [Patescibacteria group bacterium]|nr:hypothetical protein [Patescibacteria group bacterium]
MDEDREYLVKLLHVDLRWLVVEVLVIAFVFREYLRHTPYFTEFLIGLFE